MKPTLAILLLLLTSIARAQTTRSSEIRRGVEMGEDREERARRVYENIIRTFDDGE